ncbi:MAG: class I SAM-dependent methyltransferase [Defluviitaleaceae bacterium]|nr:class I SAM-dependent methyltransferase [Defluviitaleaceae bacterium]
MDAYKQFADIYDLFMAKDVPYDAWTTYIDGAIRKKFPAKGRADLTMLDMACGTGNMTLRLAALGYDIIGVDISEDMLMQAQEKSFDAGKRILWLAQDMRALDLYGTVDAAICTCDGLNYLLTDADLREVFRRLRLFMNPGGIFIFDMNTEYKFKEVMGNGAFGDTTQGAQYQWENHYDPVSRINTYRLTFQIAAPQKNGQPELFTELHRQRAYDPKDICDFLLAGGFTAVTVRDGYTDAPLSPTSLRVTFICHVQS